MKYKAIFFDRDGTLTYSNPEKSKWRDEIIEAWSGKTLDLPYEKIMNRMGLASEGKTPWYKNFDDEREFFKRYYYHLLVGEGVTEDLGNRALLLFNELWCNNDKLLFPEVIEVLEYFKSSGYKMGVISDTSPSLEYTLQQLDIAKYFTSFTASSLVGASKPSPIIFNAALNAQGVTASESLYADDYFLEADGAREQGFTSFLIDRTGLNPDRKDEEWTITNLKKIIDYAENYK
ncbi:MAG: HAD-IA family hydrolase [Oscillospiraceae bacterium]|nr:HAD-IA family hydrolase [Oscillospiraceae bacterium]